jgi:hypothetical protein
MMLAPYAATAKNVKFTGLSNKLRRGVRGKPVSHRGGQCVAVTARASAATEPDLTLVGAIRHESYDDDDDDDDERRT